MNVPAINLLPSQRAARLRARSLARRWCVWGGLHLCVLTCASLAYSFHHARSTTESHDARLIRTRLDAERANKQALTSRVGDLAKRLEAAQAVGRHPDWSILIAFLSREAGTSISIERLELRLTRRDRADRSGKRPGAQSGTLYEVTLSGVAHSMSAVNAYVGRIEASNAFDRVKLGETSVSSTDTRVTATRFSLSGEIFDSDGGAP